MKVADAERPSLVILVRAASDHSKWASRVDAFKSDRHLASRSVVVREIWIDGLSRSELQAAVEIEAQACNPGSLGIVGFGLAAGGASGLATDARLEVSKLVLLGCDARQFACDTFAGEDNRSRGVLAEGDSQPIITRQEAIAGQLFASGPCSSPDDGASGASSTDGFGDPATSKKLGCPLLLFDDAPDRNMTFGLELWPMGDVDLLEDGRHVFERDLEHEQVRERMIRFLVAPTSTDAAVLPEIENADCRTIRFFKKQKGSVK